MFKNIVWRSQIRSVFASRPFRSSIINFKPISLYTHRIRNFSTIDSSGENVDTPPVDPLLLELSSLKLENIKLQGDIKDLKDKILRVYADEENVRRIAKKDVENAKSYANSKFAKSMLDVADNLERALQNTNTELANQGENPAVKNLLTGLEMTYAELEKVFKANGVLKYGAIGETFNPEIHDALFRITDATKEAGKIGQVLKVGYKLNDRVIRAAEVGTICHPDN